MSNQRRQTQDLRLKTQDLFRSKLDRKHLFCHF